jgi:endonuclease/exonuclease/phosphatase family metal-dependent hydrolase
MNRIRLLTYNIHKGIGGRDRRYDLARTVAVIETIEPDLICLQEVDSHVRRSSLDDQPALLADHFGFHALFQLNVPVGRSGGYGNLILSRWPLEISRQHSLRIGTRKPRGLQIARVTTPSGTLALANWHLGLTHDEQVRQARMFLEHSHEQVWHDLPMILAGDTNDWGNRLLRKTLAHGGFRQASLPIVHCRSFPAWFPVASLDKVFVRKEIAHVHTHVPSFRLARTASDHRPLVAEFGIGQAETHA